MPRLHAHARQVTHVDQTNARARHAGGQSSPADLVGQARKAAEEAAASRSAAQELAARIAAEEEAALKAAEEEAEKAEATAAEEKRARLEIAFAAAEEDALRRADELFNMGCSVDQIRSLYGESILMQLRLVPRMSDVHNQVPVVPEPVVNWEATILTAFRVGSGQRRRYLRYSALAAMRTGVCVALGV